MLLLPFNIAILYTVLLYSILIRKKARLKSQAQPILVIVGTIRRCRFLSRGIDPAN